MIFPPSSKRMLFWQAMVWPTDTSCGWGAIIRLSPGTTQSWRWRKMAGMQQRSLSPREIKPIYLSFSYEESCIIHELPSENVHYPFQQIWKNKETERFAFICSRRPRLTSFLLVFSQMEREFALLHSACLRLNIIFLTKRTSNSSVGLS